MIQVHIDDKDELIISGEMQEGDIIPSLCCSGFDFQVDLVIFDVYGHCQNPAHEDGTDPYCGVQCLDVEDIALFLIDELEPINS